MHKCRSFGLDQLNLWPFYHLTFKCYLDLQPTWTNVWNGIAIPQEEQLCHIILKFMHKCRSYGPKAQFMTILSFDLQVWHWPSTYLNKCLKWHCYSSRRTTVPNYFEIIHNCRSYGPDKLNLCPFYHLIFKCDLDLQPTGTNVSNGTSTSQGEQLCQIILKSMHKCRSYVPGKLNLWSSNVTLTVNLPEKMFLNGIATPEEKQLPNYIEIHA